ncbi:hypothetical protein H2199_003850 [Coniosporium tulheliwenetii]|uniref:Uncharacterized protein n=1 Tax=Coniosporium tulheliwenetii TaxID=3383036 RepID=A0ACC2Z8Z7_9PEZI|nr:hypothetical protein H2199_003850 [Cladosporium sp. JES 115]
MRTRAQDQFDGAAPAAPRGLRRKRRGSTQSIDDLGHVAEDAPSSSPPPTAEDSQPRKKKRVRKTTTTTITEETHDIHTSTQDTEHEANQPLHEDQNIVAVIVPESQPEGGRRKVRFSDPGPPIVEIEVNETAVLTAPPSSSHELQPTKSRRARHSLPANLANTSKNLPTIEEIQYSPLTQILDDRVKRRLRRSHLSEEVNTIEEHKRDDAKVRQELERLRREMHERDERVKQLEYELESQRQMAIDVGEAEDDEKVKTMQDEIAALRKEILEREAHSEYLSSQETNGDVVMGDEVSDEDDDLVFVNPSDIPFSQEMVSTDTTTTKTVNGHSRRSLSNGKHDEPSTQTSIPDPTHEAELHNFENAIVKLTREASDARAALQILVVELQSLGFAPPEGGNRGYPFIKINQLENGPFLAALVEELRATLTELDEKTTTVTKQQELYAVLRGQYNGVLDKLAHTDQRMKNLETQWHELDTEAERRSKTIVDLEEELENANDLLEQRNAEIAEKDTMIENMGSEIDTQSQSISKLQQSLQSYRDEVSRLEEMITRLEREHAAAILVLEKRHADAIDELERKLATEQAHRAVAEQESDKKTIHITKLELRIESAETSLEKLYNELAAVEQLASNEKAQREAAEAELDSNAAFITSLENKISAAETSLDTLRAELESLRSLTESERRQREAAEAELDERATTIETLEESARKAGVEANKLRQKLFEVQQQREQAIAELKNTLAATEELHAQNMAAEMAARAAAENTILERDTTIADLEQQLQDTESAMQTAIEERDRLLAARDGDVHALTQTLRDTNEKHEAFVEQKIAEVESLHKDITTLGQTLGDRAARILELENEAVEAAQMYGMETEQRDTQIAFLQQGLNSANARISDLEADKRSLEQRVQEEAEQVLALQNAHADALAALNATLLERNTTITLLNQAVQDTTADFTNRLADRDERIADLEAEASLRAADLLAASSALADLKARFERYVDVAETTVAQNNREIKDAAQRAEVRAAEFGSLSVKELETVRAVDGAVAQAASGAAEEVNVKVAAKPGKKGKGGRKMVSQVRDSGIGVEE